MSTLTTSAVAHSGAITPRNVTNAMFVFVPLAILADYLHLGAVIVFACVAMSCIPLSYWLGKATEALAERLGPISGGLLNATFGNAAELIISAFALSHGLFLVVRTALIGSILGQLFLVLGTSLLVAGFMHGPLKFSRHLVQINFTLMAIALVAIGLPSVLTATATDGAAAIPSLLGPVLSVMLLVVYGLAVVFSLRSQPTDTGDSGGPGWSPRKALIVLSASTGGMIVISEFLVGSIVPFVEETGISEVFIGLIIIPIFGNVVDHIVAITVAMKNKMDLSVTISVGSAAQVACLVLPIVVIAGWAMGQPAGMVFAPVELIALGMGLLLMVPVLLDGSSNWLEGSQLLTGYLILATVLWVL